VRSFALCARVVAYSVLLTVGLAAGARADERPPPADEARGYERRPGSDPDDVALWVPRAILFLPRLVLGVALLPVRGAIRWLGKHTSSESGPPPPRDDASIFVWPELTHQSWFGPSVGIFVGVDNLAGSDERVQLGAALFGEVSHAESLMFSGDQIGGSPLWLETTTEYEDRPRDVFQGIGNSSKSPRTRYRQHHAQVGALVGLSHGTKTQRLRYGIRSILSERDFEADADGPDPDIPSAYDVSRITGFESGVRSLEERAEIVVDTRNARAASSSGVLFTGFAGGVPPTNGWAYGHFGADVTEFINLYHGTRVLRLRALFEDLSGDRAAIPFSALATLGGRDKLRGYAFERFRDRSALLGTLEYQYQFHAWAAGALFVETGRVAADPGGLFDRSSWHVSGGFGIRLRTADHSYFSLDLAYGEELAVYFSTAPNGAAP
jgi:outer membrane protein assembly factor BamA